MRLPSSADPLTPRPLERWLPATGIAALLTTTVALSLGRPTLALAWHVPVFGLIGWSVAQVLPRPWCAALGVCALPLAAVELLLLARP